MYKIDKRGNTYSFRYRDLDGIEKRHTCPDNILTRTEAKAEQIKFLADLKQQKVIQKAGAADIDMSWQVFCTLYRQFCSQNKKTVQRDNDTIKLIDRILKIKYFREFTTVAIRNYIDKRLEEGRKKSSINRELVCMKSMWSYAIRELKFPMAHQAQPVKKYKLPAVLKNRVLSVDEINLIFSKITDDKILTLFYLMLYTGMRLKDALNIKWHNIHFDKDVVNFAPHKTDRIEPDEDFTPMKIKLKNYLLALRKKYPNTEYVVPGCTIEYRNSKSAASHNIIDALRSLNIQGASAHTCRHSFITYLFETGNDSTDIMKWARIKDMLTLRAYKHSSREVDLQNISKLPY